MSLQAFWKKWLSQNIDKCNQKVISQPSNAPEVASDGSLSDSDNEAPEAPELTLYTEFKEMLLDTPIDEDLVEIGEGAKLEEMLHNAWNYITRLDDQNTFKKPVIIDIA